MSDAAGPGDEHPDVHERAGGNVCAGVVVSGHEYRAAWLARLLPPVEALGPDLWSIPVPMPNSPLRYTSVYALAGGSRLTLIDAGWDSDQSWAALCAGLASFGASIVDVGGCLVTHRHSDHIGLAGRVRAASGAWIGMHSAERDAILKPEFRDRERATHAHVRWLQQLGAPRDDAIRLGEAASRLDSRSTLPVPDRLIEDGEDVNLCGWSLRAVHTPGHTRGHLCFVDQRRGLLFAGDHVLPRISPNISADRDPQVDALGNYLQSLERVTGYHVREVLPAHEWRFRGLSARVAQLSAHHDQRLAELLSVVVRHPDSVAWELAGELTWSRPWDQYDGHMRLAAVGETAAHLLHLCRRGLVTAIGEPAPHYTVMRG